MSQVTPQKRVLPARERTESSAKRQAAAAATTATPSTEPRQKRQYTKRASLKQTSTPASGTSTPSTPLEETIPSKIHGSKPLPTSSTKQPEKLSNKEYQSIAESAVLAASLHRSRMQWLCEGIFKRYWSKPYKRKGVIEQPPGNPDAKSMAKLGNATMTIEPHVFDVTFYTVKDPSTIPPPYYRHPNQHTVKQNHPPTSPAPVHAPQHQQTPPSTNPPTGASPAPPKPAIPSTPVTVKHEAGESSKQETRTSQHKPQTPSAPNSAPPHPVAHPPTQSVAPAPARPANDPVIQMLATRAATDNRLKDLMKVVAMSQATPDQLREFQSHIDEFNRIIKQQEATRGDSEKSKPPWTPAAAHPATYNAPPRPHPGPPTSIGGPMHMAPPSYLPYTTPKPEPYIKHIVIEFHSEGATTDRWLWPEHAILDIKTGGMEMIASFFVVRKGEEVLKTHVSSDEDDGTFPSRLKRDLEYYQPVTVLIKATQHKTIETIARAAKSLPECQNYMKEVMEKKTRAPQEYLLHRLPREKALAESNVAEFVDSAVEMSNDEDDELKDVYGMQ